MKSTTLVALAAAMAFSLPAQEGGKSAADAAAKPTAPAAAIGVVDLVKAIEQYPKYVQGKAAIDKKGAQAKAQLDELTKQIEERVESVKMLGNKESEAARDLGADIEIKQMQRKVMGDRFREMLAVEDMRLLSEVYQDLEIAIPKVAQARNVSVVVRTHSIDPVDIAKLTPRSLQDVVQLFERRQVWYAAESVDLTADLIKLLMVPLPEKEKKDGKVGDKSTAPAPAPTPKSGG